MPPSFSSPPPPDGGGGGGGNDGGGGGGDGGGGGEGGNSDASAMYSQYAPPSAYGFGYPAPDYSTGPHPPIWHNPALLSQPPPPLVNPSSSLLAIPQVSHSSLVSSYILIY